jgi:hypothetical protein
MLKLSIDFFILLKECHNTHFELAVVKVHDWWVVQIDCFHNLTSEWIIPIDQLLGSRDCEGHDDSQDSHTNEAPNRRSKRRCTSDIQLGNRPCKQVKRPDK